MDYFQEGGGLSISNFIFGYLKKLVWAVQIIGIVFEIILSLIQVEMMGGGIIKFVILVVKEVTLIQIRGGEWSHFKKFLSLENIHYFHLMRTLKQKYLYFFALKMANNTLILQLVVKNYHFLFNSEILEGFIPSQNVPNFLHFPSFV